MSTNKDFRLPYVPRVMNYGYTFGSRTVYAYTEKEWGMGAGDGGHNTIRSFHFSLVMMILFAPVALGCLRGTRCRCASRPQAPPAAAPPSAALHRAAGAISVGCAHNSSNRQGLAGPGFRSRGRSP